MYFFNVSNFSPQGASGKQVSSPEERRRSGGGEGGGGGKTRSPRQAPEGEESVRGGGLVRQGTFNVDEEGAEGEVDAPVALNATLDAHLTRTKGVKQLK